MGTGGRILILVLAVAFAAPQDREEVEAPERWEDELLALEPVRLSSGAAEQRIELTIERWGEAEGPQTFVLSVEQKPSFIEETAWEPGAEVELDPEDTAKTVHLVLKSAGSGSGETDLVVLVRAGDESLSPRERRLAFPFVFGRAKPEGSIRLIRHDAPEKIDGKDLLEHVDLEAEPLYCCDRVAVFFTPPVDLDSEKLVFHWGVTWMRDDEESESEEENPSYAGCWDPGDWFHNEGVGRFAEGEAPAVFGMELIPFGDPKKTRFHPGRYVVSVAAQEESEDSLLGEKGATRGEWEEVTSFALEGLPELRFAGIECDPAVREDLSGSDEIVDGVAEIAPASAGGRTLRLEGRADFLGVKHRYPDGRVVPWDDRANIRRSVEVTFPETLSLSETEMGDLKCVLKREGCEHWPLGANLDFCAVIYDLIPVGEGELDETLVLADEPPRSLAGIVRERKEGEYRVYAPSDLYKKMIPTVLYGDGTDRYTVYYSLYGLCGRPSRPLGDHLRNGNAKFVLPVRFSYLVDIGDRSTIDQFAYVIYEVKNS